MAFAVRLGDDEAFLSGLHHELHFRQFAELLAGGTFPGGIDNLFRALMKSRDVWIRPRPAYTFPVARKHTHTDLQFSALLDDPDCWL